ncbi:MAG: dTDP-4-dehydrorhamnose reductase [Sedimentisphaerales bacterium]|nr:dTDP-4-dehydrorhamnose reductase [Sedimentisphaerales bacterium]
MKTGQATVVILGGRGMLGTDLAQACKQRNIKTKIFDLPEFDITNEEQLKKAVASSDLIVNCAAYTNVDGAESETALAHKVNAEAVGCLGQIAKGTGKWVFHISTDFVFDGNLDRPYIETDEPNPISEYGKSKLAGEQLLVESGCANCIMRVQWTYGKAGSNFVKKIIERARQTGKLKVVDDQVGSPTATTEAAKAICELLTKQPVGLFHFASAGYVSRFGMAKFIIEKLNMNVELQACKSSNFQAPAGRPLNSRFCCDKISAILDEPIRHWQRPLEEFLEEL